MILASGSPRRSEILKREGIDFQVVIPNTDEHFDGKSSIEQQAMDVAKEKAEAIVEFHANETILSADTIVVYDGEVYGKPKDKEDAYRMLQNLNGQTHKVITAFCVYKDGVYLTDYAETEVEFHTVTVKQINDYIATSEPLSRAGAYAIQEQGAFLVKRYVGDFDTVVGLPISKIKKYL